MDFLRGKMIPRDWMAVAMFLGVTAAIVGLFYYTVHKKTVDKTEITRAQNENVASDLVRAQQIDDNLEELEKNTDEIRGLVVAFERRLPSKREITRLVRVFEDMAAEESIDVDLSPMDVISTENKETIPYKIVATGPFHDVAGFINRLERYERYLKISDLEMDPYEDGVTTFTFTLNTYRFIQ